MKTVQVQIVPSDVIKLLGQNNEYPDVFTHTSNGRGLIVLEHFIDGSPTTLEITLTENGQWFAKKHVEV